MANSSDILISMRQKFIREHPTVDPHLIVINIDYTSDDRDPGKPFKLRYLTWPNIVHYFSTWEQSLLMYMQEILADDTLFYTITITGNGRSGKEVLIYDIPSSFGE